ncbi:putative F-box/LRR-repeat protein 22 [Miscanthus floridulus]|uniref:putative F-box/LRR-repeat protein 22 n=1 Tax=Miscanthus floridulus TaxID=154761 RepID=UPI00345774AB
MSSSSLPPSPASPMVPAEDEARDWAEMPSDALAAVFAKLDVAEILLGAGLVCRAWRRLAASDPTLWRRVDMTYQGDQLQTEEVEAMARAAVDRSAGTMEAFGAETFVNDELLRYISQRAPSLKSLHLCLCHSVTNEGFAEAINCFPLLEELDVTFCSLNGSMCETTGRACPQLKCFRLNERWSVLQSEFAPYEGMDDDTEALGIASTMPGLQELQLIGNQLTNDGLMAILDRCPRLESLDIRQCYNIQMDDALKSKCARIRDLKLPHDSISDFRYRAYIVSSISNLGSDFELDMYDDLLDVVTEDDDADFDDMNDFDDTVSDGGMYDDDFDI